MFLSKKLLLVIFVSFVVSLVLVFMVARQPIEQKKEMTAKEFFKLPDPPKVNTSYTAPRAGQ